MPPLIIELNNSTIIEDKDILVQGLNISPISINLQSKVDANKYDQNNNSEQFKLPGKILKKKTSSSVQEEIVQIKEKVVKSENVAFKKDNFSDQKPFKDLNAQKKDQISISKVESFPKKTANTTVRINISLLNRLMNLAGELVLIRNQNIQSIQSGDMNQLLSISKKLNIITTDLQTSIMQTRMQPMDKVFSKFTRLVRDSSKKVN